MKTYGVILVFPALLLADTHVLASVGWPGAVLLVLTLLLGGARRGLGQIYIDSYRFLPTAAGFPLWNKDPYTTTDISNTLTEITALGATQSLNTATFGSITGTLKWIGGVLAPNGKIYGIPYSSTSILEILATFSVNTNFPLSRLFNKL